MNDDQKKIYYAKEENKRLQAQVDIFKENFWKAVLRYLYLKVAQITADLANSEHKRLEENKLNASQAESQAKQIKVLHNSLDEMKLDAQSRAKQSNSSDKQDLLQLSIDMSELTTESDRLRAQIAELTAQRDELIVEKKKMEVNYSERFRSMEALIAELEAGMEDSQQENDRLSTV